MREKKMLYQGNFKFKIKYSPYIEKRGNKKERYFYR